MSSQFDGKSSGDGFSQDSEKKDTLLNEFGEFSQPSEFGEQFGPPQTNAVTDLFDESFSTEERRKKILIGVAAGAIFLLSLAYIGMTFWASDEDLPDFMAGVDKVMDEVDETLAGMEDEEEELPNPNQQASEMTQPLPAERSSSSKPSQSVSRKPVSRGGSYSVNLRSRGATFQAEPDSYVQVSLNSSFTQTFFQTYTRSGEVRLPSPPFGRIYWKSSRNGSVREMNIVKPAELGLSFQKKGREMTWSAQGEVGYFRVTLAQDRSFRQVLSQVSTIESQARFPSISAGSYYVKLEGLNLASGIWESIQSSVDLN